MLVDVYDVMVMRSMDTHIKVTVPQHEAEILRLVHGDEGVQLLDREPVGKMEVGAVYEERERLNMKYGMKNADTPWVSVLYPSDAALKKALGVGDGPGAESRGRGRKADA